MALGGSSCPLGEHYLRSHPRSTKKGMTRVFAHCRKNSKGKENLLDASNLRHIYYSSGPKKYPRLPAIKGFRGFHHYHSSLIFNLRTLYVDAKQEEGDKSQ